MQSKTIPYNPALLRWARDNAGLSLHEAVLREKIKPPRQSNNKECFTPEDRLSSWEEGRASPSLSQLESLAKAYRRPLVTFFISNPPSQVNPLMDYRTTCNASNTSPEFATIKRRIIQLHRELNAIAKEEMVTALDFVGSCSMQNCITATVEVIRKTLDITPIRKQHSHNHDAFINLRAKAHVAGIYVVLMGDLGSQHSMVSPDEFRGIAIADKLTPLVVINSHDVKVAMPFTLAHEIAHIFLGNNCISNQFIFTTHKIHKSIDYFCNTVATELLVPEQVLRNVWNNQHGELVDFIKRITRNFNVSEEVIARRLYDINLIDITEYRELIAIYQARWMRLKKKNKDANSGPDANALARHNIGEKTLGALLRAIDNGVITIQDAARALNISVGRFERIVG